ncbi:hypothetical protein [Paenibacillus woosongensis]|nr:hypothetical protein [Paenibacillus woosongensis]
MSKAEWKKDHPMDHRAGAASRTGGILLAEWADEWEWRARSSG